MKASIDYEGVCLLLAAIVRQARKDAHRDPCAMAFLQSIGARLIVPTRIEPMRLGDALNKNKTADRRHERTG
jgi:hypothetical protein